MKTKMTKLLRISTAIACALMFAIIIGQIYMWEGRRMGREEFARQVVDMERRLREMEIQLQDKQDLRLNYFVYKILDCESNHKHQNIWGDDGQAYGIAQFHEATFYDFASRAGLKNPQWKNQHQQILLLKWAIWQGIAKKHWQRCWRQVS